MKHAWAIIKAKRYTNNAWDYMRFKILLNPKIRKNENKNIYKILKPINIPL
jgi:hypothetical protein